MATGAAAAEQDEDEEGERGRGDEREQQVALSRSGRIQMRATGGLFGCFKQVPPPPPQMTARLTIGAGNR